MKKYVLVGDENAVRNVIRENRIRIQRGVISITPLEDAEQPATEQPTVVEGEQKGDDVIDDKENISDDSKEVVKEDNKIIEEDDSKEVEEDDSKEVVEEDSKVVEEEPKNKKSKK